MRINTKITPVAFNDVHSNKRNYNEALTKGINNFITEYSKNVPKLGHLRAEASISQPESLDELIKFNEQNRDNPDVHYLQASRMELTLNVPNEDGITADDLRAFIPKMLNINVMYRLTKQVAGLSDLTNQTLDQNIDNITTLDDFSKFFAITPLVVNYRSPRKVLSRDILHSQTIRHHALDSKWDLNQLKTPKDNGE